MHPLLIHFIYFDIYYIKWEMNWSWLDLTWPWLVLDLTFTGRLRVSCWWYLIGFRLARGYRRRPSSVSSLSTADSLGGKRIRSPGVRWKLDGSLNIIVLLQQLQNFTKSELDHQTFLSPRGARCLRVGYCKRCCQSTHPNFDIKFSMYNSYCNITDLLILTLIIF